MNASTFVLVALYLQQSLSMAPQQAGLAMVPTSLTGFAFSLTLSITGFRPTRVRLVTVTRPFTGRTLAGHPTWLW